MKLYMSIILLILVSIASDADEKQEMSSVVQELEIESISFATIIYSPKGRDGNSVATFVNDKEFLDELYQILAVKKSNNNMCKEFPNDIYRWMIYLHSDNQIYQLNTISSYLESPTKGLLYEPKLFELLNKKIKKE